MTVSAYVLVSISTVLLAASFSTIVVLLDTAAQNSISDAVFELQKKSLALSSESVQKEVLIIIPSLDRFIIELNTGWASCADMTKETLQEFFQSQIRTMMLKIMVFLYTSEMRNYLNASRDPLQNWWLDCTCYWFPGNEIGCVRPVEDRFEEMYGPHSQFFPFNTTAPTSVREKNYTEQYYEQRIASLTATKHINGSWSSPYYYYDDLSQISYALQTLTIPLRFTDDGRCTKAASADVSLNRVGDILNTARASSSTTLFILDPALEVLVSISDPSIVLWNENKELWPAVASPSEVVRVVSKEYFSTWTVAERISQPDGFITHFETSLSPSERLLVATRHIRHKDLLWVILDVTPRDVYFGKMESARVESVSIGAAVAVVALIITVGIFIYLIRNLRLLGMEMDKLATMDVETAPLSSNPISELDRVVKTFNHVVMNLRLFKSLIPESVFDALNNPNNMNDSVIGGGDGVVEYEDGVEDGTNTPHSGVNKSGENSLQSGCRGGGGGGAKGKRRSQNAYTVQQSQQSPQRENLTNSPVGSYASSEAQRTAKDVNYLRDTFALRLEPKVGTFVEVRLTDFISQALTMGGRSSDALVDLHAKYVSYCNHLFKDYKGVLGHLIADRMLFHWNVQVRVSGAQGKAAQAVLLMLHGSSEGREVACLHTGRVVAGYVGTEGMRSYQILGTHTELFNKMFFRMEENRVKLLCSYAIQQELSMSYELREIDEIAGRSSDTHNPTTSNQNGRLFELRQSLADHNDETPIVEEEWMYQFEYQDVDDFESSTITRKDEKLPKPEKQQNHRAQRMVVVSEFFEDIWNLWRAGDARKQLEAVSKLESYCNSNERDVPGRALLRRWKEEIQD
eukprot:PhF_6_TR40441/c0_g1_i1/m.60358